MSLITWIKKVIRMNRRSKEPIYLGERVPVHQSLEFTNHQLFVEKAFSFLEEEWGFPPPTSDWQPRGEYHTMYKNQELNIEIMFEPGTLPHVFVSKGTEGALDYACHYLARLHTDKQLRQLYATHLSRVEPKVRRWLDRIRYDNIYDKREIEEDYKQWGQGEHEQILGLYANFLKTHSEILKGNFPSFSSTSQLDEENSSK